MITSPVEAQDCYEIFVFRPDGSSWSVAELGTFRTTTSAERAKGLLELFLGYDVFCRELEELVPDADDRDALRQLRADLTAWGTDGKRVRVEVAPLGAVWNSYVDEEDDMPDTILLDDDERKREFVVVTAELR